MALNPRRARVCLCGLTFELSGRRWQDARPGLAKMYPVPPDRAWWPAVVARLARTLDRTNTHCDTLAVYVRSAYTAGMLRFEWDPKKAAGNVRKHGVSFEDAQTVFSDENAKLIDDPDHSEDEDRFVLLGFSSSLRLLVVCHCYRSEDNVIRLISARKAEGHERDSYP